MKRDLDLIREILLTLEAETPLEAIAGHTIQDLNAHLVLAIEAGLLVGATQPLAGLEDDWPLAIVQRLSWAGYDFLDAARSPNRWAQVRSQILKAGGQWTLDLVKELLQQELRSQLGL